MPDARLPLSALLLTLLLALVTPTSSAQPVESFSSADYVEVTATPNLQAVQPGQQLVIAITLDVRDGWHAQSHAPLVNNLIPFSIDVADGPFTAYPPQYDPGYIANYPAISPETDGDVSVYSGRTVHYLPIEIARDVEAGSSLEITGSVRVQVCDDQACKAPADAAWSVTLPIVAEGTPTPATQQGERFAGFDPASWAALKPVEATPVVTASGTRGSVFGLEFDLAALGPVAVLSLAFVAGIFFNVVPCVLPVLPLKIISFYETAQHSRAKCVAHGVAFGLGIVLTFATLGLLIFAFGAISWGEMFSNPWFAGGVTLVLVAAALYQFGLFSLALPSGVYGSDYAAGGKGGLVGNVGFGVFTAILSTPCTFGLFLALLIWAAAQPAWLGVASVTTVGIGMAAPYVLLSLVPEVARSFPRTGAWSEAIKQASGFVLLAVAAYFVRPILPDAVRGPAIWWVVWGCVAAGMLFLVVTAVRLKTTRGIVVTGLLALLLAGGTLPLAYRLANPPAGWIAFADADLSPTRGPVLVKFTADWCANCQTIEQRVFGTQAQMDAWQAEGLTLVKADLTKPDAAGWDLLAELNPAKAIPFTAVYLPDRDGPVALPGIYGSEDVRDVVGGG
jgi:thiol:disulfide interchange protein DsbD